MQPSKREREESPESDDKDFRQILGAWIKEGEVQIAETEKKVKKWKRQLVSLNELEAGETC
jgi:hypothetical protein